MKNIIPNPNVKKIFEKKPFEIWLLMSHFVPHYCEPSRFHYFVELMFNERDMNLKETDWVNIYGAFDSQVWIVHISYYQ